MKCFTNLFFQSICLINVFPQNYAPPLINTGKQIHIIKLEPKMIQLMFPESIEIQSAFYVYQELSLIAEVGGYVGLFLGYSVYQITDMFDIFFHSLKRKLLRKMFLRFTCNLFLFLNCHTMD